MILYGVKGLLSEVENLNIGGKFFEIIKDMYENSKCEMSIRNQVTNFFQCNRGTRQGCPLNPFLFNIHWLLTLIIQTHHL